MSKLPSQSNIPKRNLHRGELKIETFEKGGGNENEAKGRRNPVNQCNGNQLLAI